MDKIYESFKAEDTFDIGKKMGEAAQKGDVYALKGDLGVGKTVFTKGFAKGLGIEEHISSPTFTILNSYEDGRMPFHHFDVYRIGDIEEMDEIGYEDCFYGDGVSLVEWAGIIKELMPKNTVIITIEKDLEKGFDYRKISVGRNLEEL